MDMNGLEGKSDGEGLTLLLRRAEDGEPGAMDALMERVYDDLRGIAERRMRQQFGSGAEGVTLDPSGLVHETYLRLIKQRKRFDNRGQFFAIATRTMMRVLVDYQRSRSAKKRDGGIRVTLTGIGAQVSDDPAVDVQQVQQAMEALEELDPRTAEVVKLRALWGLTVVEIAETLDVSESTARREWRFGRRWLQARL